MVKLAKHRKSVFEILTVNPPGWLRFGEGGVFDLDDNMQRADIDRDSVLLLAALICIADGDGRIKTNTTLQHLAGNLFIEFLEGGDGKVVKDDFRKEYFFYKMILDSIWDTAKIQRRKDKKFGDPKYPKLQEMKDAINNLVLGGILNEDYSIKLTKGEIALMKQRLEREGFKIPKPKNPEIVI